MSGDNRGPDGTIQGIHPLQYKYVEQAGNMLDDNGNPLGGFIRGVGMQIDWQRGPLGRGEERQRPNGAFVEGVLEAALVRLRFYQKASDGKFACKENADAIKAVKKALKVLNKRTAKREKRGVEGTYEK